MAFTVHDFHDLTRLLAAHPEWQAELRRLVLSEELLTLPALVRELVEAQTRTEERLDRLEAVVRELAEAQTRTEERLNRLEAVVRELAEAQTRTEERITELIEAQTRTEAEIRRLAEKQSKMGIRLDQLVGDNLERRYRERAYAYFGPILRRVRVVSLQELETSLESHLSQAEMSDLTLLDLLVQGQAGRQPDAPQVWLAVEVSAVVDPTDVERAQRRAALLRRAGYAAIPTAAGEEVAQSAEDAALAEGIFLLRDGRRMNWEEALARALAATP